MIVDKLHNLLDIEMCAILKQHLIIVQLFPVYLPHSQYRRMKNTKG